MKKIRTAKGDYSEKFNPLINKYQPSNSFVLAIGQFDDRDGVFIEWLGTGTIVVRIDGKDYRQTIEEFINNCK